MSAAVIPAAPLPATTMSNSAPSAGSVVMPPPRPILEHVTVFAEGSPRPNWDVKTDVVVVGFGAAGACAALRAGSP